jgi:hypothetical protein
MSASPDFQTDLGQSARSSIAVPGLLGRMKGMLLTPKAEWTLIVVESTSSARLYRGFILPLAAFVAGVAFVNVSIVGRVEPLMGVVRAPLRVGLMSAGLVFGFALLGMFLTTLIIDALATFFGASHSRRLACATACYASTPVWIATAFSAFPTLWAPLYLLAVLYHTYLLSLGLQMLMKAPRDRVFGYASTIVLCTILIEIVFTMASVALGGATHMNPYTTFS